ncbi:MAG: hypothetical protein NT013_28250 [Planctomycetia bacterium]|nr:hypothetical protein [Planctomycetia bacterium]
MSGALRGMAKGAIVGALSGGVIGGLDGYTVRGSFDDALDGAVNGALMGAAIGGLTGGIGGGFQKFFSGLGLLVKLRLLNVLFTLNAAGTIAGVATAKSIPQGIFRSGLGILGFASILSLRQAILAKHELLLEFQRLGQDAAQGAVVPKQGLGGVRIQQVLGRRITASTDPAQDFMDGSRALELKGPFVNPNTLEPIPNPNISDIATGIQLAVTSKPYIHTFFVDTLGLTDDQAIQLAGLLAGISKVRVIR